MSKRNFNSFILNNIKFAEYLKSNAKNNSLKTKHSFGKQLHFDRKEKEHFLSLTTDKVCHHLKMIKLIFKYRDYITECTKNNFK